MPPPVVPHILPEPDDSEAKALKKKALLLAAALTGAFTAPKGNTFVPKATHFITGIEVKPRVGIKVKPAFALWALPAPYGAAPPSWWNLPPYVDSWKYQLRRIGLFGGLDVNRAIAAEYEKQYGQQKAIELWEGIISRHTNKEDLVKVVKEFVAATPADAPNLERIAFLKKELIRKQLSTDLIDAKFPRLSKGDTVLQDTFAAAPEKLGGAAGIVASEEPPTAEEEALFWNALEAFFAANPPDP